jgi:outer membrane protein TolC
MPRWGNFDTMWQAGISFNLPVWTARKQSHAVAESRSRGKAARASSDAIRQLLRQRVYERLAVLRALVEANRLYRSGLLVQSEATVASTLAQYQVGRVTFASALEALAGYLADRNGFLDSVAAAQRIAIAEREISLEAPAGRADGGMAGAASTGPSVAPNPASPGPLPSVPRAAPSMPRM